MTFSITSLPLDRRHGFVVERPLKLGRCSAGPDVVGVGSGLM
ncbi:hypothetical protein [Rhodococcus erythropolis]|jgi:hypothetical protein|nr:hypothetical protein [Rhodococcus erythropolis]